MIRPLKFGDYVCDKSKKIDHKKAFGWFVKCVTKKDRRFGRKIVKAELTNKEGLYWIAYIGCLEKIGEK